MRCRFQDLGAAVVRRVGRYYAESWQRHYVCRKGNDEGAVCVVCDLAGQVGARDDDRVLKDAVFEGLRR